MEAAICRAVAGRRLIAFVYPGTRPPERMVEPHILGHAADGGLILSAWQLSGGSGPGWRNYHVAEISDLAVLEDGFERSRPDYNPADRTFARILCRL